ncbi:MAG: DUF523 and DUF1722 domain-containing protein [Pseudomonadota bacterium]
MEERIRVGISSCLLGENVRYNGGHCRDGFIATTLSKYLDFVPVCPEVEAGFGIPRETMRLVGDPRSPRLVTTKTELDHTERMLQWSTGRVGELEEHKLCGFIFKSGSPSSGMERVKVYSENGMPTKTGVGLFARAFMDHFPLLPVEEEGRLCDPKLRENFIESLFTLKRWRECVASRISKGGMIDFHSRNKLLLLAHSPKHYQVMGRLVAGIAELSREDFQDRYQQLLLEALKLKTTEKKNSNVLLHVLGYFKKVLSSDEKQEAVEIIDAYRNGYIPLVVPVTLLNHFVRKYDQAYLKTQTFLNPHPLELRLRNHA